MVKETIIISSGTEHFFLFPRKHISSVFLILPLFFYLKNILFIVNKANLYTIDYKATSYICNDAI